LGKEYVREPAWWTTDEEILALHSLLRIQTGESTREAETALLADLLQRKPGGIEGKFGDLSEWHGSERGRTALDKEILRKFGDVLSAQLREAASKAEERIRSGAVVPNFEVAKEYSRLRDIHERFGGQRQGGISTPSGQPFIVLFTGQSGERFGYKDEWVQDGSFRYVGEGQIGDMEFVAGNKAIRDHAVNGKDLLLFTSLGKGKPVRYEGRFECAYWERADGFDVNESRRKIFIFHLVPEREQFDSTPQETDPEFERLDLAALKERAYRAANSGAEECDPKHGIRSFYKRSAAVKAYVLARAHGICEACKQPAPFQRVDGTPYLEPHHTMRLSDGGLDHPSAVAGICPTCHRRIHHGHDGKEYNGTLIELLKTIETT
jgi:5-methylcytosine-specific restriction protein A